jgi:uncharacterized DUF497 family protein
MYLRSKCATYFVSTEILTHRIYVSTLYRVEISYDPKKNARNIAKRGLSFDRVHEFDFGNATTEVDDRVDYGETRLVAVGFLDQRLHVLCFVETGADAIRVISFRKANKGEERKYAQDKAIN